MKVDANSIDKLSKTLSGFAWLAENHEVTVVSAVVEIDGNEYEIERDYTDELAVNFA